MLWAAIPVALAAAFSPWTLLVTAHLLSGARPLRQALIFLVAAASITLAIGYVVVLALNDKGIDDTRHHRTLPASLDLAVGVAILLFAVFVARRPARAPKVRRRREMGLLGIVALGGIAGSPSPLYLASLHSIAKGHPDGVGVALEVLLIAALVLLMAEIPIVMFILKPARTTAALDAANGWLAAHARVILLVVAAVVGIYFIVNGLDHLL